MNAFWAIPYKQFILVRTIFKNLARTMFNNYINNSIRVLSSQIPEKRNSKNGITICRFRITSIRFSKFCCLDFIHVIFCQHLTIHKWVHPHLAQLSVGSSKSLVGASTPLQKCWVH